MFQNIATFRAMGARRRMIPVTLKHANDNRITQTGRPILASRWRPNAVGKLECYWKIEIAGGGGAAEEPDGQSDDGTYLCVSSLG